MQKTVVCIDNDPGILVIYRSILADCGYEVLIAPEGRFGLHQLEHHVVDVVLVDYDMPEMDGGIVAAEISRRMPNVAIVLISGYDEVPAEVSGHIQAFVGKPFTTQQLLHSVETAIAAKSEPILSENLTDIADP